MRIQFRCFARKIQWQWTHLTTKWIKWFASYFTYCKFNTYFYSPALPADFCFIKRILILFLEWGVGRFRRNFASCVDSIKNCTSIAMHIEFGFFECSFDWVGRFFDCWNQSERTPKGYVRRSAILKNIGNYFSSNSSKKRTIFYFVF